MKTVEFANGISKELGQILKENEIITRVETEARIYAMSDSDYLYLRDCAPQVFESVEIIDATYDVCFNDNSKGFTDTKEDCINYIRIYNGKDASYFKDYRGGIVSVIRNETGETVYKEVVR